MITSFDPEMHGLNTFACLFHSREAKNLTLYNGWNFTRTYEWDSLTPDSFWYSPNTIMIFETEKFQIGTQASENVVLDLQPEKYIMKGQNYTSKLFGIFPIGASDKTIVSCIWKKTMNVNPDYRINLKPPQAFNNSDLVV